MNSLRFDHSDSLTAADWRNLSDCAAERLSSCIKQATMGKPEYFEQADREGETMLILFDRYKNHPGTVNN